MILQKERRECALQDGIFHPLKIGLTFSNTINNGRVKSSAIGNDLKSSKGWNSGTHKDIYGFSAISSGSMGGDRHR